MRVSSIEACTINYPIIKTKKRHIKNCVLYLETGPTKRHIFTLSGKKENSTLTYFGIALCTVLMNNNNFPQESSMKMELQNVRSTLVIQPSLRHKMK